MKVSIITVVYNNELFIFDAINSILSQSYFNIEHIIIDGCSTDKTLNIIKSFKSDNIRLVSEPDLGIYDAMNKGINIATGDIIGILNSDDFYANNNIIEKIVGKFLEDKNLMILYGNLIYVNRENTDKVVRTWISIDYFDNFFETGNVPPHPTLFLKKNVYNIAGNFDLNYKLAADYDFMLRIFKFHNLKSLYINELFVVMRLGGASNKNLKNIIIGNLEIYRSWKKNNFNFPIFLMPLKFVKRLVQFFK